MDLPIGIATLTTDVSHSPKHNIGAYAFLLSMQNKRIHHSGILKECENSTDGELKTIGNAAAWTLKKYPGISRLIINTDCIDAHNHIFGKTPRYKYDPDWKAFCDQIKEILSKTNFEIRHVKGHSSNPAARNKANNFVDKLAKRALSMEIQKRNMNKMNGNLFEQEMPAGIKALMQINKTTDAKGEFPCPACSKPFKFVRLGPKRVLRASCTSCQLSITE